MGRLIQSTRQILDVHNNLLYQYEQLRISERIGVLSPADSDDDMSFLSLFSFFVSLLSPYVYYSSVFTLCCKQLEQYDSFYSFNPEPLRTPKSRPLRTPIRVTSTECR